MTENISKVEVVKEDGAKGSDSPVEEKKTGRVNRRKKRVSEKAIQREAEIEALSNLEVKHPSKLLNKARGLVDKEGSLALSQVEIAQIESDGVSADDIEEIKKQVLEKKYNRRVLEKLDKLMPDNAPMHLAMSSPTKGKMQTEPAYLHTHQAVSVMFGRRAGVDANGNSIAPIVGYFDAVKKIDKVVIPAYYKNCPYASYFLLKQEAEMHEYKLFLEKLSQEFSSYISSQTNLKYKLLESGNPQKYSLSFSNNYAWHLFDRVIEFDNFMRFVLPYKIAKYITNEDFREIYYEASGKMTRMLSATMGYYFVGRKAFKAKDDVLLSAESKFGTIPPSILSGEKSPNLVGMNVKTHYSTERLKQSKQKRSQRVKAGVKHENTQEKKTLTLKEKKQDEKNDAKKGD